MSYKHTTVKKIGNSKKKQKDAMRISKLRKMSLIELEACRTRTKNEYEDEALTAELDYRKWCRENNEDPENEDSREHYQIVQQESGSIFWEDLDEDEREGWEHNMTKDSD